MRHFGGLLLGFFNFDIKKMLFFLLLISLPILSINMEQKSGADVWFDEPFRWAARSVQQFFVFFSQDVKDTTALYVNLIDIKKMNEQLIGENNELRARYQRMGELMLENNRMKNLLGFRESTSMELVPAQVIGRDLVSDHNTLTINKGTDHGLQNGQAVISMDGAVGYVFRPTRTTSHVMLITDRYAVVDGVVQRSRAHGIIEGKGSNDCSLKYVERTEDVKEGDIVVTGGLDNLFPKGLPAAVVKSVERKTFSVSLKVDLVPVVDPGKVEEVFVILNAKNVDLTASMAIPKKEE